MKSSLMSIQPYYAYLEMKGIKTVEIRKTEPKDTEWSGKVKVYVSQNKKSFKRIPKEDRVWFSQYLGKVAYEFACNKVDKVINYGSNFKIIIDESIGYTNRVAEQFGLDFHDLKKYLETKDGYAWHITDLKIYDKPKELGEITTYTTRRRYTTKKAKEFTGDGINIEKLMHGNRVEARIITKPPQSWQYIQELEEQNKW